MSTIDEQGRPEPPVDADEVAAALGFLDYQRATLAWKCRGVDAEGLRRTVGVSTMTLGGIVKHLAWVELYWFAWRLHGHEWGPPWDAVDWDADPDWEWTSAAADSPEELRRLWTDAVDDARRCIDDAIADGGFDRLAVTPWPNGERPNLRWIVLHMIEEYARHNGHADLLREAVDGETGE